MPVQPHCREGTFRAFVEHVCNTQCLGPLRSEYGGTVDLQCTQCRGVLWEGNYML